VVPGTFDLEEPETVKKMFRDGERKVIGGVSGGIAAYFGLDLILVRVLFIVFTFFFGVGFAIYIVLWIALPEASFSICGSIACNRVWIRSSTASFYDYQKSQRKLL